MIRLTSRARWTCGAAMLLAAMTAAPAQTQGSIKCLATYRERMTLSAGAVLEATLEEVTKEDAPGVAIANVRIENPGTPPFRFEIPYDTGKIVESNRYAVRARVAIGGKPVFLSQSHPVLTQGHGTEVQILLRRPAPAPPTPPEIP